MKVKPLIMTSTSGLSRSPSTRGSSWDGRSCRSKNAANTWRFRLGAWSAILHIMAHPSASRGQPKHLYGSRKQLETVVKSSTSTWTSRWSGRCQPIARRSQRCICKQDRLVLRDAFGGSVVGNSFSSYVWLLRQTAKLTDGRVVPCPTDLQAII